MEVEFTYAINNFSPDAWAALAAECARVANLNRNLVSFQLLEPDWDDGVDGGYASFVSAGHDQSAIKRKIVAPIRNIFHKVGIKPDQISLINTRVLPNGRSLTLAEGRTPKYTYIDPSLGQMMADAAKLDGSSPGGV